MPIELWLAFVAASALLFIHPGPTIFTVGRRADRPA